MITGLEFGHIVLHQPLPVADQDIFGEILNLTQVLNVSGIQVDRINYSSYKEVGACDGRYYGGTREL